MQAMCLRNGVVKVRDALLALLARHPAHGYQLKVDYERITGAGPVNVGQIYTTLDRLRRDDLVDRDTDSGDRRVPYYLTDKGRSSAVTWLFDPGDPSTNGRSAVAGKVLLALGVPGIDTHAVIDAHRFALLASVQATRQRTRNHTLDLEGRLVIEAEVAVSEAELRWLDLCEAELRTAERNP
jgi:DNA-binding PadR family transcriptional regulator